MKQENKLVWWEKTVEYTYLSLLTQGFVIAPLAGELEIAGDAVLHWDEYNWFLIEFKRSKDGFTSENKKYTNAEGELHDYIFQLLEDVVYLRDLGEAEPHYFVYATHVENGTLRLAARRYWGDWCDQEDFHIENSPVQNFARTP